MKQTITVIYGGPSPEHDISILTGLQCERILSAAGATVHQIYWTRLGGWELVPNGREARDFLEGAPGGSTTLELRVDAEPGFYERRALKRRMLDLGVVVNCCHGGPGESGPLNGLLELLGVPATGGPSTAAALGMDKLAFGGLIAAAGLPCLERRGLHPEVDALGFDGPYIVKPRFGGSSLGIEVATDLQTAKDLLRNSVMLRDGAVIEPFRSNAVDLNLAFRTFPHFEVSLLERPLRAETEFYTYEDKYLRGSGLESAPRELPALVPDNVTAYAGELAYEVAQLVGVTGLSRLDFLYVDEELYINELNTIPGAMSLYLWPTTLPYAQLLLGIVAEASQRKQPYLASGAGSGAALRVAGGIAGKLDPARMAIP